MKRLLHVVSFTSDLALSKRFYRDGLGLTVGADTPFMVNFSTDGAGLVLLSVPPAQRKEVELCFESERVTSTVEKLQSRGVEFVDELRHLAFGTVIHFRDPEGNLLSLLQPGSGAGESTSEREARAAARANADTDEARGALALAEAAYGTATGGPALSTAIVNARDLTAARAYYSHLLALRESLDSPAWVQYDTGDIRLALYSRRDRNAIELHHAQPVSFGFTVDHLGEWMDEARARGVEFLSAPTDEGFGLTAEIVDPEGNVVVVREPVSEATLEERLAEAWEDEVPHQVAMRSPVRKAEKHASWVAVKPDYKPVKKAAPKPAATDAESVDGVTAERTRRPVTSRGAGSTGTRRSPRTPSDAERSRIRPATGRQKKATARVLGTAKKAVAKAGKLKPVKRAVTKRGKAAKQRAVTKRRGKA